MVAQEAATPCALHAAALMAAHEAPEARAVFVEEEGHGVKVLGGEPHLRRRSSEAEKGTKGAHGGLTGGSVEHLTPTYHVTRLNPT